MLHEKPAPKRVVFHPLSRRLSGIFISVFPDFSRKIRRLSDNLSRVFRGYLLQQSTVVAELLYKIRKIKERFLYKIAHKGENKKEYRKCSI